MTTINLNSGYLIEIDPLNYTLKQKISGKTKSGEEKESVRTHGYYGNMTQVIEKYLQLRQLDEMDGVAVDLKEYAETIENINKTSVEGLEVALGKVYAEGLK